MLLHKTQYDTIGTLRQSKIVTIVVSSFIIYKIYFPSIIGYIHQADFHCLSRDINCQANHGAHVSGHKIKDVLNAIFAL